MSFDVSSSARYAADFTLAIPSILGVARYNSTLLTITNDQINFDDVSTSRSTSSQRLLVADGYRAYAGTTDGYLNPMVRQKSGEQLAVSNGQITDNEIMFGPVVFPYTYNGFSGGLNTALFQPAIASNNNVQIYIQIQGSGLSPLGNYFLIKQIMVENMNDILYSIKLEATVSMVFV